MESPEKNTGKEEREKLQEDIRQIYLTLGTEADDEDAFEEEDSEDDALNIDTDVDENSHSQHGSLGNSCQASESLQEDASYIIREMDAEESSQWEPTTEICLQLNVAYQNLLVELLQKIELSLAENRERQNSLEAEVAGKTVKKQEASENYSISLRLIPFFKDSDHRTPPPNQDVLTKRWLNELKQNMAPPRSWNSTERKKLVECVKTDTRAKLMRPYMNRKELYLEKMEKCSTEEGRDELTQKIKGTENDMFKVKLLSDAEIFLQVDVDKVDWLKISNMDFDALHDHVQCKMMWLNGVRPGINRASWSPEENAKLNELVEKYERRNWPKIAEELGTGRVAFQCLQHYQKSVKSDLSRNPWTPEEDSMMLEIIDTCRISTRIPWTQISYYMEGRSPNNCFSRWQAMDPSVRHGKWTEKEDKLLMTAIKLFGVGNWSRASVCVPGRNSSQCRDRWNNSVDPTLTLAPFSYEEDKLVLTMTRAGAHKQGWHNVTSRLPGRTDNMVYQRYKRLLRWQQMDDWYQRQTDESKKYFKEKYSTLARDPDTSEKMENKGQIWAEIDRQQGILESDYEKQERDRLAGDIVVPRPPRNTRKPSVKIAKLIARREKMQQHLLNVVDPLILEEAHKHLSESQPTSDQGERFKNNFVSIINQVHHSMTVRQMLKLARQLEKGGLTGQFRVGQTVAQKIKKKKKRSKQRAVEVEIAKVLTFYIRQKRTKRGRPSRLLDKNITGKNPTGNSVDCSKVIAMTMSLLMKALDMDSNAMRINALKKMAERDKEKSSATVPNQPTERVTRTSPSGAVARSPASSRKRTQPSSTDPGTVTTSDKKCPRLSGECENNSLDEVRMSKTDASKIIVIDNTRSDTFSELDNIPTEKEKPSLPSDDVPVMKRQRRRWQTASVRSRRSVRLRTTPPADAQTEAEMGDIAMLQEVNLISRVHFPSATATGASPHVGKTLQSNTPSKGVQSKTPSKGVQHKIPSKGSKSTTKTGNQQSRTETEAANAVPEKAKRQPFLPPSAANLDAFKKLLLKRRDLISSASKNYNKSFYKKRRDQLKIKGEGAIKNETIAETTKQSIEDPLEKIRETGDYKRLKSRFESLMIWPAFLSATVPPSLGGTNSTETAAGPQPADLPQEAQCPQQPDKHVFKTRPRKKSKVGVHTKSFYKFQRKSREYKDDFKRRRLETVAKRKEQGLIPKKPKSPVSVDPETFNLPPLLDADGNPIKRKRGRQPGSLGNMKWLKIAENTQPRSTRQTRSDGPAVIEPR